MDSEKLDLLVQAQIKANVIAIALGTSFFKLTASCYL